MECRKGTWGLLETWPHDMSYKQVVGRQNSHACIFNHCVAFVSCNPEPSLRAIVEHPRGCEPNIPYRLFHEERLPS